jgi:hypothetical protein
VNPVPACTEPAVVVVQRVGAFTGEVPAASWRVPEASCRADEADRGGLVREDPHDTGSALDLLVDPLD